ncbi:MAG: hypothetical protein ACE5ER_04505 [Nitrospinaceae bacterium]
MIVDTGLQHIADQMSTKTQAPMSHMAAGTGAVAPAAGDTAMGTEISRVALTSVIRNDKTVDYVATFGVGVGTGALTEAGILNAASAGTMLSRITFAVKNKGANDTMTITIQHTYQRG